MGLVYVQKVVVNEGRERTSNKKLAILFLFFFFFPFCEITFLFSFLGLNHIFLWSMGLCLMQEITLWIPMSFFSHPRKVDGKRKRHTYIHVSHNIIIRDKEKEGQPNGVGSRVYIGRGANPKLRFIKKNSIVGSYTIDW